MKKYIKKIFSEVFEEKLGRITVGVATEQIHNLFAYISITRLERIIEQAKSKDEKYVCLAEMYSQICRENLAKENSEIIHNYFEFKPLLNKYYSAIEKQID